MFAVLVALVGLPAGLEVIDLNDLDGDLAQAGFLGSPPAVLAVHDGVFIGAVGADHDGLRQASEMPDLIHELGERLLRHGVGIVFVRLHRRDGESRGRIHGATSAVSARLASIRAVSAAQVSSASR